MRNNFRFVAALLIAALYSVSVFAADREWKEVPGRLPYYKYTGTYDDDPAILVGNSRVKIRTHMSGLYELISGERCWAIFNADPQRPDYGKNRATVYVSNTKYELAGPSSLAMTPGKCEVYSGAGFVRYDYNLGNGLKCSRMISVMPSDNPEQSVPFCLITLTFSNEGKVTRYISYDEALSPNYIQSGLQNIPESERSVRYNTSTEIRFRCMKASFGAVPQQFVSLAVPQARAMEEFDPRSVFMYCDNAFLVVNEGELKASVNEFRLPAGRKHTFHIVVGLSEDGSREMAEALVRKAEGSNEGAYSSMWKKRIPDFSHERDKNVRNELYRCAYLTEASKVYSDYFEECFIPGDFLRACSSGENASNSDHINAALQACYTDPSLAKSIIRYVMKQTSFDGMVPEGNKGYGYIPSDSYTSNLVPLEVMNALAEYLIRTQDYSFLDEWLTVYPMERGEMKSVKSIIESYFIHLRSKSQVSSEMYAMQAAVLPKLVEQMEKSDRMSAEFMNALKAYTQRSVERFESMKIYSHTDLPYIMEAQCLTNSQKRDVLEKAIAFMTADIRCIPGLAAFDVMEAQTLFRTFITQNMKSHDADVMDAWAIYSYFRIKE